MSPMTFLAKKGLRLNARSKWQDAEEGLPMRVLRRSPKQLKGAKNSIRLI